MGVFYKQKKIKSCNAKRGRQWKQTNKQICTFVFLCRGLHDYNVHLMSDPEGNS